MLDKLLPKTLIPQNSSTPSGLKISYLQEYTRYNDKDLFSSCQNDSFENIKDPLTFYDVDSNPITERLNEPKRKRH